MAVTKSVKNRVTTFSGKPVEFAVTRMMFGWVCWFVVCILCSCFTFIHFIMGAIPDDNWFGLRWQRRLAVWTCCPLVQCLFDNEVGPPLASHFAKYFGMQISALLHAWRLNVVCFVPLVAALVFSEHCAGGWVWFWDVCRNDSKLFDVQVELENPLSPRYHKITHKVLDTVLDVCTDPYSWWEQSTVCDRDVVESMAKFLSIRLVTLAFVNPMMYIIRYWFGRWKHSRGELMVRQCRDVSSVFMVAVVWVPFVPCLMAIVFVAILTHWTVFHLIVQVGSDRTDIDQPTDAMGFTRTMGRLSQTVFLEVGAKPEVFLENGEEHSANHRAHLVIFELTLGFLWPNVWFCALLMCYFASANDLHGAWFLYSVVGLGHLMVVFLLLRLMTRTVTHERNTANNQDFAGASSSAAGSVELTRMNSIRSSESWSM